MRLSRLIYQTLLRFYPDDLALTFGQEMTEAFSEDLAGAWRERSASAIAAAWYCALSEVVTIAIPRRLANPALRTRAVSVALHIAVMGAVLVLVGITEAMPNHEWHGVVELRLPPPTGGR